VKWLIVVTGLIPGMGEAQHGIFSSLRDVESVAIGRAGVCSWEHGSTLVNPANACVDGLSSVTVLGSSYYFVTGLYFLAIHWEQSLTNSSGLSVVVCRDGGPNYAEHLLGVAYGRKIGAHSSMGLGFHGAFANPKLSSKIFQAGVRWGICTQVSANCKLGAVVNNPFLLFDRNNYTLPFSFAGGINYRVYKGLELLAELHKEGLSRPGLAVGILYSPSLNLRIGTGLNAIGPSLCLGISYRPLRRLEWSLAMESHPALGLRLSHGIRYILSNVRNANRTD
jgi:hypothetical protein